MQNSESCGNLSLLNCIKALILRNIGLIPLQQIEDALARFSGIKRFPSELESAYEKHIARKRAVQILWSGCGVLLVMNLFLLNDYAVRPDLFGFAVWMRTGFVSLPGLLLIWLIYRGGSARLREWGACIAFTVTNIGTAMLLWQTHSSYANYDGYHIVLLVLISNMLIPLYFRTCLCISLLGMLIHLPVFVLHPNIQHDAKMAAVLSYCITTALTLVTNFRLEVASRRNFLVTERDRALTSQTQEVNHKLRHASYTDPLTHLPNRRHFEEMFAQCLQMHKDQPLPMAVLMIDVDHFKYYNDTWGHPQGDVCLRQVAQVVQAQMYNGNDVVARMGGEEFSVLLLGADLQDAWKAAERIRWAVEQTPIAVAASQETHKVTVSIGVALATSTQQAMTSSLLERADAALYVAKRSGRNNVQVDAKSLQMLRDAA